MGSLHFLSVSLSSSKNTRTTQSQTHLFCPRTDVLVASPLASTVTASREFAKPCCGKNTNRECTDDRNPMIRQILLPAATGILYFIYPWKEFGNCSSFTDDIWLIGIWLFGWSWKRNRRVSRLGGHGTLGWPHVPSARYRRVFLFISFCLLIIPWDPASALSTHMPGVSSRCICSNTSQKFSRHCTHAFPPFHQKPDTAQFHFIISHKFGPLAISQQVLIGSFTNSSYRCSVAAWMP